MTVKKHAINISLIMIAVSLGIALLCWPFSGDGVPALLFVLSTGVFGSSFATLWIFVYEYNRAKYELLKSIFDNAVDITENNGICSLAHFGFHDSDVKAAMTGRHYLSPLPTEKVSVMDKQARCHYELCRFIDEVLEIGYDRIRNVCEMVESVDLWSDSFRRNKYRSMVVRHISLPLYEVFVSAPAMEDGYLFRYFKDFKVNCACSAEVVYPFVAELDKALYGTGMELKYSWQSCMDLRGHMHEKLWIFRDAFYSPHVSAKERRMAKRAFLKGTPYPYIR